MASPADQLPLCFSDFTSPPSMKQRKAVIANAEIPKPSVGSGVFRPDSGASAAGGAFSERLLAEVAGIPADQLYDGLREAVDHHVDLGAQAGGEDDRLSHVVALAQGSQQLGLLLNAQPLPVLPGRLARIAGAHSEVLFRLRAAPV